jgi:hypothetical protein
MNKPVYQGQDEADQEYVCVGDQLGVIPCRRHVEPQSHTDGGVNQCPYQKSSIEVHYCLQSSGPERKVDASGKRELKPTTARGLCRSAKHDV